MNKPLKVLIIEDSEADAILILSLLRRGGYDPRFQRVASAAELSVALKQPPWDIVLADHRMPGFNSIEALGMVKALDPDLPFIIVSGVIGDDLAVAAMKAGAQDYLMKSNLARLVVAVERELIEAADRRARREAERALLAQREELRIARDVQQRLFPERPPRVAGCDLAGASIAATATGGDYYDFIADAAGGLYVVEGDVTGHGLGPALLMADVRAYLRALLLSGRSLPEILSQTRHLLKADLGSDLFITLFLARLEPSRRTWEYISAGHPAGHVLAADGRLKTELVSSTSALGIDESTPPPESGRMVLAPGDLVLLMTDGVVEARSRANEEFGEERALDVVRRAQARPAAEIVQRLLEAAREHAGPDNVQDDMTAIVLKL